MDDGGEVEEGEGRIDKNVECEKRSRTQKKRGKKEVGERKKKQCEQIKRRTGREFRYQRK